MAGLGQCCNHVAALLFKVEDAVNNGFNTVTCTSMPCTWNRGCSKPIKNVPLSSIENLFKKDVYGKQKCRRLSKVDFKPSKINKNSERGHQDLVQNVLKGIYLLKSNAPVLKSVSNDELLKMGIMTRNIPLQQKIPDNMVCQAKKFVSNLSGKVLIEKLTSDFIRTLKISDQEIEIAEEATREQADCFEWKNLRQGMITASNANKYSDKIELMKIGRNRTDTTYLVNSCLSANTKDLSKVPSVKWGCDHEKDAQKEFTAVEGKNHLNFLVKNCGLFISKGYPFLGARPDGIVYCNCCPFRCLEIKCPYSIREEDPCDLDVLAKVGFIDIVGGVPCLKKSHGYYAQVQMQMALTKATSCNFVIWTKKNISVMKIGFDLPFWRRLESNLVLFYRDHVCKSLLADAVL
eukprot:Seg809.8 transcript_id=Seg809.8/GoldUCD/mRNA.D3Y31 product="hypothetical protein" protein_id=Seg809.8/GoldUCD/D3Y31